MVERDIGDDRQQWCYDIGTVKTSSQSYLDDSDIDMLLCKVFESHRSSEFKEGWLKGFEERSLLLYKVYDILMRNGVSVDSYPLIKVHQMWRGIESYLVSTQLQIGSQGV